MATKRKRMGPEERRNASRRLLVLGSKIVAGTVRVAADVADGTLDHPEAGLELTANLIELDHLLGDVKRDREDADDTPADAEGG